jgi:maleylpyruvate isomerase
MTTTARPRTLDWMTAGYDYFALCLRQVSDDQLDRPSGLPGWSGKHVVAHVGHNAGALARLTHWAATGTPTPMYDSPAARGAEIESGALWPAPKLRAFVDAEQYRLTAALRELTRDQWQAEVVTAQGRTVPATGIPWLRSRELWIHSCDLGATGDFRDFPADFLDALIGDALDRRRTAQSVTITVQPTDRAGAPEAIADPDTHVEAPAADLARWLTGRGTATTLRTAAGNPPPVLPPWL